MKHTNFQKIVILLITIIIILFLAFKFIMPAAAQTSIGTGTATPIPDSSPSIFSQEQKNDLELLKNKVDIISEFNDRLMSTVQWTIGIVITVLIVILGANWFTTYRQVSSEVESFKAATLFNITKESELIKDQLEKKFDKQFSSFTKEVNSSISTQLTSMNQEIIDLRVCQLESVARYWEEKGVWANAITQYTEIINLDPSTALIAKYLEDLQHAIIKYGKKLSGWDVERIELAMNRLSDSTNTRILSTKILEITKNQT